MHTARKTYFRRAMRNPRKNKRLHLKALTGLAFVTGLAGAQDTLWINASTWTPQGQPVPAIRLNASSEFALRNTRVERPADEAASVVLVNLDDAAHVAAVWADEELANVELAAGGTATLAWPALAAGTYGIGLTDDLGKWHGGRSLLAVTSASDTLPTFYWNLAEWDTDRMDSVAAGGTPSGFGPYVPRYFTINEAMHPQTLEDPEALVALPVNASALIRVHNAGAMDHVLHFHGFHVEILSSTHHPERVGWSKDTQPVKVGEGITFRLFADQTGIYPVHDHNLIAVTNAGLYPGGMLTQIHVTP